MTDRAWWRGHGPLCPAELAEAAVMADVAVVLCLIGWLFPIASVFIAAASAPMAAIAARNRPRAVLAGGVAGTIVGLLIAGTGLATNMAGCAIIGTLLGVAWRRRWGPVRTVAVAVTVIWPPIAIGADVTIGLLSGLRKLVLAQITNTWSGTSLSLRQMGLSHLSRAIDPVVRSMVAHWWLGLPGILLVLILASTFVGCIVAWPVLGRLERGGAADPHEDAPGGPGPGRDLWGRPARSAPAVRPVPPVPPPAVAGPDGGRGPAAAGPVPVELIHVSYQYPGVTTAALRDVSLTVRPGEFVAVVGPNGSGKSTLARILGGRAPTTGEVRRPGAVAPGQPGGTAMIFQRPESQVLGVRARDDLLWGLAAGQVVDVNHLLDRVGLPGFADRETSTLSGGELQRLAVAAALARRPNLLISDESTAMVDPEGRELLTDLLAGLADEGIAVVHVTHRAEEAARADYVLHLDGGRLIEAPEPASPEQVADAVTAPAGRPPVLALSEVGHVYSAGSPWSHRALEGIDLELTPGEGILVVGHNGSGKSTLAWVLAGLLAPSEGTANLDGRSVDRCVGQVALSFQHARLQLLRSSVRSDIRAASGVDDEGADAAIALVGLDPAAVGWRSVDQLSGGQQRRVALAGLLARRPRVLILDEPFAGLDTASRMGLIAVLRRLQVDSGVTLILVSHDTGGAEQLVTRVVSLENGGIVADERAAARLGQPVPDAVDTDPAAAEGWRA